jgi:two-component system sensor histidine kinase RegB
MPWRPAKPRRSAAHDDPLLLRELNVPRNPVVLAIRNVLKNAQEATADAQPVEIGISSGDGECCIAVTDRGSGMRPEVLERAGEPFFTTKEPGQGMGLGLFLSRTVLARLGGRIELDSVVGRGTTVRLFLPAKRLESPAHARTAGATVPAPSSRRSLTTIVSCETDWRAHC